MNIFEPHPASTPERDVALDSNRVTVVFADDHPLFREGIAHSISSYCDLELVGEATDGTSALSLVEQLEPDIALLDIKMPGLDGIAVCSQVTAKGLRTRVVLLSAFLSPQLVPRAVAAGAAGYLAKDATPEELRGALLEVARGGSCLRGP
jgi:two-component system nitrate/nitrite response regulator NarL